MGITVCNIYNKDDNGEVTLFVVYVVYAIRCKIKKKNFVITV